MSETTVELPTHTEVWHCEQPERYRVLRDWWDYSTEELVRHVYEVEEA